ncbi:MAG: alpha/beta hydrolase [Bacilli bacterium]|nr:alpha/beta hydrolase [Bacilli bacterium]
MKKKPLLIALSIVGVLTLSVGVLSICDLNTTNLVIQNMFSPKKDFTKDKFEGQSLLDIKYSSLSEANTLDLYLPKDVTNPRLLVLIHGGGFSYNDSRSRQSRFMYDYFRKQGYAVASINYRLSGEALFPASLNDVKSALRFLTKNSGEYGYNAQNLALWGESAGGYLSAMATLTSNDSYRDTKFIGEEELDAPVDYKIGTLIDYYGLSNIESVSSDWNELKVPTWLLSAVGSNKRLESKDSDLAKYFDYPLSKDGQYLKELSPYNHIDSSLDKNLKVFITHGDVDITVPYLQSEALSSKLKEYLDPDNVKYVLEHNFKHADDRFYTDSKLEQLKNWIE